MKSIISSYCPCDSYMNLRFLRPTERGCISCERVNDENSVYFAMLITGILRYAYT